MSARKSDQNPSKSKGHRYKKAEIMKFTQLAKRLGVYPAARETGVPHSTLYRWLSVKDIFPVVPSSNVDSPQLLPSKPSRIQVPEETQKRVLAVWKHNPGFGPSQIRNQLRRVGTSCDTKTIRKILLAHLKCQTSVGSPQVMK